MGEGCPQEAEQSRRKSENHVVGIRQLGLCSPLSCRSVYQQRAKAERRKRGWGVLVLSAPQGQAWLGCGAGRSLRTVSSASPTKPQAPGLRSRPG